MGEGMTHQLGLFDAPAIESSLTCAFSEPWMGEHPLCEAEVERACAAFDAAVARGEYDAHGYTPNERKAQEKRRARP
jgi:hypothetical protein